MHENKRERQTERASYYFAVYAFVCNEDLILIRNLFGSKFTNVSAL